VVQRAMEGDARSLDREHGEDVGRGRGCRRRGGAVLAEATAVWVVSVLGLAVCGENRGRRKC
jgi:hypothetical protein